MTYYAPIKLTTQIQPGKPRDPFLEQQTDVIQGVLSQLLIRNPLRTLVASGVATIDDWYILADATNGNMTVTLPLSAFSLRAIGVKKKDATANTVTVLTTGTDLIDGAASAVLTIQYQSVDCVPDGVSSWWIF